MQNFKLSLIFSDIGKFPDLTECFEEGISDPERKNSSWSKSSPILVFSADSAKRGYTNVHDFNDCKLTFYSQKSPEEIPEILTLFSFVILEKKPKTFWEKKLILCGLNNFVDLSHLVVSL